MAAMGSIRTEIPNLESDWDTAMSNMADKTDTLIGKLQTAIDKAKYLLELISQISGDYTPPGIPTPTPPPTPPPTPAPAPGPGPRNSYSAGAYSLPIYSLPAMAGATTNQTFNMNFNTTISSGMDQALFEGRVRQTVRDAMRGN